MKLPVDFEQKVKLPPLVNGRSYPYQISAKDLMDDFKYAALQVDDVVVDGLQLVETIAGDGTRTVKLDGEIAFYHPWKCTANGDDTIYVGDGRIHSFLDGDNPGLASISMAGFGEWGGGYVAVTEATGVIYGEVVSTASIYPLLDIVADSSGESGDVNITLLRTMPDPQAYITVGFAQTIPRDPTANTFYWEIAQVALTNGIASITKQVLRHDPMLWSFTTTT